MRLLTRNLSRVYLKKRSIVRDEEGEKITVYASEGVKLDMNIQSAGGAVSAQIYGERLPYIKTCKYQGKELIPGQNEKDGVCVYVDSDQEPDYEIIAIQPFSTHFNVTLEKLR